jgi:hypothetical protein
MKAEKTADHELEQEGTMQLWRLRPALSMVDARRHTVRPESARCARSSLLTSVFVAEHHACWAMYLETARTGRQEAKRDFQRRVQMSQIFRPVSSEEGVPAIQEQVVATDRPRKSGNECRLAQANRAADPGQAPGIQPPLQELRHHAHRRAQGLRRPARSRPWRTQAQPQALPPPRRRTGLRPRRTNMRGTPRPHRTAVRSHSAVQG